MPKQKQFEFISINGKRQIAKEILSNQKINIRTPKTQTLKEAKKSKAYKNYLLRRKIANRKIKILLLSKKLIDKEHINIYNINSNIDNIQTEIKKIHNKKSKKQKVKNLKIRLSKEKNKLKKSNFILKKRLKKQLNSFDDKDLITFIHTYFNVWVLFGEESPKNRKSFSISFNSNFGSKGFFTEEFCKQHSKPSYYKTIESLRIYIKNNPSKIKLLSQNKYTYQVYRVVRRKSGNYYQPLYYISKDAIKI